MFTAISFHVYVLHYNQHCDYCFECMASSLHIGFAVMPEALALAVYFRINRGFHLYEQKNQFEPSAWRLHLFSSSLSKYKLHRRIKVKAHSQLIYQYEPVRLRTLYCAGLLRDNCSLILGVM